jgi:hypothetical protein
MAVQTASLEATLELMRARALRLEQESAALRIELDEVAIQLNWQSTRTVSPHTLQKLAVSETEIVNYRKMTGAQFPDAVLRLTLQAQKAATRLKQVVHPEEREAVVNAVLAALHQAATSLGLTIPDELEAAIGD